MAVKHVNHRASRTLRLHLYCPHRFLFPSHRSSLSCSASVLAAEDTPTVDPSLIDATNMRRHESTSCTTCTAPRRSSPSSGPYLLDMHVPVYELVSPHFVGSFCPRPPALYASFPSFTLAFCDRMSLHPFRRCARRLTVGYKFADLRMIRAMIRPTNVAVAVRVCH